MPTTDAQLQKKREDVEKLRQQVADETAKLAMAQSDLVNDVVANQLDDEGKKLQSELAALKVRSSAKAVAAGAAAVVDPVGNAERIHVAREEALAAGAAELQNPKEKK